MKLLVFALFSCMSFEAAGAQEKQDEVSLKRGGSISELQADATGVALYEVRDIADSIGAETEEPSKGDATKRTPSDDRVRHVPGDRHAVTMTRTVFNADGTSVTEQLDPAREERIERGTPLLAELIKRNLEPAFDPNLHSINVSSPGVLAIVATGAQHAWLARFFALAKQTNDLVQIETRWVMGPRGSFEKLGLKSSSTLPTQDEFAVLLKKFEEDKTGADEFTQLLAPRLIARNMQRATISSLEQISYIKEWHVTFVQPGPQEIADPFVDTINAGEKLEVRAVRVDVNLFRLALEVEHVAVAQPIPTKKVRVSVAPGGEAEVGLPVVTRVNFSADVKLVGGNAVVLVTPLDEKKDLALIVKLTRYTDELAAEPVPERK
jgi:hypothetical protein